MIDAFTCTWRNVMMNWKTLQGKTWYQVNVQRHLSVWYLSNKILMAGGGSFYPSCILQNPFCVLHPVLSNSCMLQCSFVDKLQSTWPWPSAVSWAFWSPKNTNLCKSFGKNKKKKLQEVGVLSIVTNNIRVLQVNLSYFCCSNTADLLYKANSLPCSLLHAHFFPVHYTGLLPIHIVCCLQTRDCPHWCFLSLVKVGYRKMRLTELMP